MAGLLGNGFDDPQSAAIMALAGGLLQGNFGAGLLGANDAFAQHKANALKQQMAQMQMENMRSEIEARKAAQAQAEREAQGLPGLFRSPQSMSPGAFSAPVDGVGPTMSPQDAPSMPGGFDLQGAMRLGIRDPKRLAEFAALANIGKPKVARTVEVMRNGKPTLIQLDESGQEIGAGYDQWKSPLMQNLGGRTVALDPVSLSERGSFAQSMSPEGKDASARGWATVGQGERRLALEAANGAAGKAPAGYRFKADGSLEAIPGGPADIKAGELGAKADQRAASVAASTENVLSAVKDARSMIGPTTAGLGASLANVPGTPARNLRAKLETIKANLGFDRLQQMRSESPTGGALGAVAVQELIALQSTVASLDQEQGPKQLQQSLDKIEKHYTRWNEVVQQSKGGKGGAGGGWSIQKVN